MQWWWGVKVIPPQNFSTLSTQIIFNELCLPITGTCFRVISKRHSKQSLGHKNAGISCIPAISTIP